MIFKYLTTTLLIFSAAACIPQYFLFSSVPVDSMETWRCVYCGEKNPVTCSVCHNCGKSNK